MDFVDAQPEFTKAVWDYLDILVTDARLTRGREMLTQHRATFDAVEKAYGVDRYIVAAIWGIESNYSTQAGRPSTVLRSTATLACVGRRQAYFKDEFLSALDILHRGDLRPDQLKGSWAGAFGATQFMPTAFKRSAVDFDGDGRRDVVDRSPTYSPRPRTSSKRTAGAAAEAWGYEVVVPRGFNYACWQTAARTSPSPSGKSSASAAPAASLPARKRHGISAGARRRGRSRLFDAA